MTYYTRPEVIPGEPWRDKVARLAMKYPPVRGGYKKFQAGDRVRYKGEGSGGTMREWEEGNPAGNAEWNLSKSDQGTVVAVTKFGKYGNQAPWVVVEPDPVAGFGFMMFSPHRLENLTCPNWRKRP